MIQVVCMEQKDFILSYKDFDEKDTDKMIEYVRGCLKSEKTIKIAIIKYPFKEV